MRYWNPKRAAAHRIAEDALTKYGPEIIGQLVDNIRPDISRGEFMKATQSGTFSANARQVPSLPVKLGELRESDPGMFRMVVSELSKYGSGGNRASQG